MRLDLLTFASVATLPTAEIVRQLAPRPDAPRGAGGDAAVPASMREAKRAAVGAGNTPQRADAGAGGGAGAALGGTTGTCAGMGSAPGGGGGGSAGWA